MFVLEKVNFLGCFDRSGKIVAVTRKRDAAFFNFQTDFKHGNGITL